MLLYTSMALAEDVNCQKKGLVIVLFNLGERRIPVDLQAGIKIPPLLSTLPIKTVALHHCFDDPRTLPLVSLIMYMVGSRTRVRCRSHSGTIFGEVAFHRPESCFSVCHCDRFFGGSLEFLFLFLFFAFGYHLL